jgi:hypothetical protein
VYYRDRGWFDSDYYSPTTLGPFKRALGALFDWFFARVYKRTEAHTCTAELPGASQEAAGAEK